jgi:hypothetical protein
MLRQRDQPLVQAQRPQEPERERKDRHLPARAPEPVRPEQRDRRQRQEPRVQAQEPRQAKEQRQALAPQQA